LPTTLRNEHLVNKFLAAMKACWDQSWVNWQLLMVLKWILIYLWKIYNRLYLTMLALPDVVDLMCCKILRAANLSIKGFFHNVHWDVEGQLCYHQCRESCLSLCDMALITREYMAQTCSITLGAICSYSYEAQLSCAMCTMRAHFPHFTMCALSCTWAPYSASHPEASIHCPPSC
jgi:hypothetical protein